MLMHASSSIESVRPLRNAERVSRFRKHTEPLTDQERMATDPEAPSSGAGHELIHAGLAHPPTQGQSTLRQAGNLYHRRKHR